MPNLGVNVISEIQWCRFRREFHDVAFRAYRINAILENVIANLCEQILALITRFEYLTQKTNLLVKRSGGAATFFVSPVGRNAEFSLAVHFM